MFFFSTRSFHRMFMRRGKIGIQDKVVDKATRDMGKLLGISVRRAWIACGESGLGEQEQTSLLVRDVFNVCQPWPSSRNQAAETARVRAIPCPGSGYQDHLHLRLGRSNAPGTPCLSVRTLVQPPPTTRLPSPQTTPQLPNGNSPRALHYGPRTHA